MQVSLDNNIYRTQRQYSFANSTLPNKNSNYNTGNYNPSFCAATATKPVISNKISNEKSRILKKLNEILKTNIPILDKDQLWEVIERRAIAIIRMKNRKKFMHENELEAIYNSPYMTNQQKINRVCEIDKEKKEIEKIDPFAIPDYLIPKETKEKYDYKLIEKFKLALNENNFDLRSVYQEHYADLRNITTVEELNEKYPSISVPPSFEDVVADKIIKTLPRDAYIELEKAVNEENDDAINKFILDYLIEKTITVLKEAGHNDVNYMSDVVRNLSKRFARTCAKTIAENRLSAIPVVAKSDTPEITNIDKLISQINYDNFVLHVLREHYLEGKKLNEITYTEDDKTIKLIDLKGSEYKFEKFSENIKKFITDSEKIKQYQRDYLKFTQNELKERLLYYEKTDFGYDDDLFALFAEFESCKFTEEDKNNLIILLKELDKVSDNQKTLEEAKEFIKRSNIRAHGTNKIDEETKKEIRAQIRAEQQRNEKLTNIRNDFNTTINTLYEIGLISEADLCLKYYPLTNDSNDMEKAELVVNYIKNCINNYDKKIAQIKIARWETCSDYKEKDSTSIEFKNAQKYSLDIAHKSDEEFIGQYLINRNIVDGYPESAQLFSDPELLKDIIQETGKNKDLATRLLCRYENYKQLPMEERSFVFKVLEHFNEDKALDKTILKYVIENDYINCDTAIIVERENKPQTRTIAAKAKREVLAQYKFPKSLEFFKKFENALPLDARNENSSGIKKTDKYDKKMSIKYELKIMGDTDRLFACNKDFYFDSYSEIGFH